AQSGTNCLAYVPYSTAARGVGVFVGDGEGLRSLDHELEDGLEIRNVAELIGVNVRDSGISAPVTNGEANVPLEVVTITLVLPTVIVLESYFSEIAVAKTSLG